MAFLGLELVNQLGISQFKKLDGFVSERTELPNGGIFLMTTNEAFSGNNPQHRELEQKL